MLQSGWHGGWLDSAQFVTETSQLLALQRHHRVPAQLLSQCAIVLDVIQPVCLPLVFDTCGDTPTDEMTHPGETVSGHFLIPSM